MRQAVGRPCYDLRTGDGAGHVMTVKQMYSRRRHDRGIGGGAGRVVTVYRRRAGHVMTVGQAGGSANWAGGVLTVGQAGGRPCVTISQGTTWRRRRR